MDDLEILVHIAAPATRKHDDLCYSLAEEYSQFAPHYVHGTRDTRPGFEQGRVGIAAPGGSFSSHIGNGSVPAATRDANISNDTYGSFPSDMDSVKQSSSPRRDLTQASTQEDGVRPISRLEQLERMQTRWREQNASTARTSLGHLQRQSTAQTVSSTNWEDAILDDTQLAYQAMCGQSQILGGESQMLDTISTTSADTSEDEAAPVVERTPLMTSAGNAVFESSQVTPKSPVPWKTPASVMSVAAHPRLASPPPPSAYSAHSPTVASQVAAEKDGAPDFGFQNLPYEVLPPAPTVTVNTPGTLPSQITPLLHRLKQQNPRRFRPSKKSRELDLDERGHWLVDCSTWPSSTQLDFWTSLADYTRTGRLGWGVTLHRENDFSHQLGVVRLYCWGQITEHVWLSMWLCSHGKIAGSGSEWLDGGGDAVIEVD